MPGSCSPDGFESVEPARQPHVDDGRIHSLPLDYRQRGSAISDRGDSKPGIPQYRFDELADIFVVVDDEDA